MHFSLYIVLVWAKGHTLKYSQVEISPNNDQVINSSSISLQGFKTEALTVVISLWGSCDRHMHRHTDEPQAVNPTNCKKLWT